METKIKKEHTDYGFGFPVNINNIPMIKIRGQWTPNIDYNHLTKTVLTLLCYKSSRLTGNEIHFIRQHFAMTLQAFAQRFYVTHAAVIKWEACYDNSTPMHWSTEKDIRLFAFSMIDKSEKCFLELYQQLAKKVSGAAQSITVDMQLLAA